MSTPEVLVVLCTVSSDQEGRTIAGALVERGQAACVNLIPQVRSIFRWKGQVCDEAEGLLIVKTTPAMLENVRQTIRDLHSYELPEILAIPVAGGDPAYIDWVAGEIGPVTGTS